MSPIVLGLFEWIECSLEWLEARFGETVLLDAWSPTSYTPRLH